MDGYYRWPTICGDDVVFGAEDDLWRITVAGGVARRLTANLGAISHPFFSPDGSTLAFSSREEGPLEVYTMDSQGGPVCRATYLGANSTAIGWHPTSGRVLFSSDARQPFSGVGAVLSVAPEGDTPRDEPYGIAVSITFGPDKGVVVGRHSNDPARWKRYRGGTAGDIWADVDGSGTFQPLLRLDGNMARPMWIHDRVYFLSDHEGVGNIYSCLPGGEDLRRHTDFVDYFVRFPSSDGRRIVFHAGADLYLLEPGADAPRQIPVDFRSPRIQRQRKFVDPIKNLERFDIHPEGHTVALTVRGRCAIAGNWDGAAAFLRDPTCNDEPGARYRCAAWLHDGVRIAALVDRGSEEALEVHWTDGSRSPERFGDLDLGRVYRLRASPTEDFVVAWNHRRELLLIDLSTGELRNLERNEWGEIGGAEWSPDGRWIAYHASISRYRNAIKLWSRETGTVTQITDPILTDEHPVFDTEGKYLYFIGTRELNPVYDNVHFDLGFPRGQRPFLIPLQADTRSPFMRLPSAETKERQTDKGDEGREDIKKPVPVVVVDLEGIRDRVVGFPVPEGRLSGLRAAREKVFFLRWPLSGALHQSGDSAENDAQGRMECYNLKTQTCEPFVDGVTEYDLTPDGSHMIYRAQDRIRVVPTESKPDEKAAAEPPGRKSGWIDLGRIRVLVEPGAEWRQMAREAWRLQRDYFWTSDMSTVDWESVWDRYRPLIERVSTRGEFSDLMWEMQGELGTSHAYEFGGDYRPAPTYLQGFLGADIVYDLEQGGAVVRRIIRGAPGEQDAFSPLQLPGIQINDGDVILSVNGQPIDHELALGKALMNLPSSDVVLRVRCNGEERSVTTRTLATEFPIRYRQWVESNREAVHHATDGRIGYVHIPDMGAYGYSEFHRLYLTEVECDGLIIDVRFNRGGHVSQLLLEKLARRRIGYDVPRWGQPEPYPAHSVAGPMVMLTNQYAGSDGDIVSHCFKLMGLGPLIGTRTWGGVIGIGPHNPLVDGGMTTQPEYSFWFTDVGWGVENYGTDPDIEVQMTPQDYVNGRDPQLDQAIATIREMLAERPPLKPAFDDRPRLPLPTSLPPRT